MERVKSLFDFIGDKLTMSPDERKQFASQVGAVFSTVVDAVENTVEAVVDKFIRIVIPGVALDDEASELALIILNKFENKIEDAIAALFHVKFNYPDMDTSTGSPDTEIGINLKSLLDKVDNKAEAAVIALMKAKKWID